MTRIKLEQISDITLVRDLVKQIAKQRHEESWSYRKYITYLDENNLYGWWMSEYLPYGGFKWLKNIGNFHVNSISEKSPIGYLLEVDLE